MWSEKKTPSNWLENRLKKLHQLVQTERRIGIEILELLWEIERRKSYSELGFDGIYSFCIRELKFTEAQAYHRIQAMRALKMNSKEVGEEIQNKIKSSAMSVSTVAQVQVFLKKEEVQGLRRTEVQKLELFQQFESKSSQEVKKGIAELKGGGLKTKLVIELDLETETLWNEFKACTAFQTKGDVQLQLKLLLKEAFRAREVKVPKSKVAKSKAPDSSRSASVMTWPGKSSDTKTVAQKNCALIKPVKISITRYIARRVPVQVRRQIFKRDQYQCVHCGSKYALSIEHKVPFAKGGTHDLSNLILLCRNCNLHQGVKQFGLEAMRR